MYSLADYGSMIADGGRFAAYAKAIADAVRPGDTVAEIGCGPGAFSLLACRAGARRVFAIDLDDSIHSARQLAAANGFTDRIEFFQSDSRKTELPERVNVIVSDIRGALPFRGSAIPSIEDARQRFLAPGGLLIPQRDVVKAAVIEAKEYYQGLAAPWQKAVGGVDLSSLLSLVLNGYYAASFNPEQLFTEPLTWHVLDYTVGAATHAASVLRFRIVRTGTAHGLCLWFETQLLGGISYSSGPGGSATIYGQIFLPWLDPVAVAEGQEIQVELRADLVGQDYVWSWNTTILACDAAPPIHFRQSTFLGAKFSPQSLRRQAVDYVPVLSQAGQADLWMLERMDGKTTLQEIAQSAWPRFPRLFSSWREALQRAVDLSRDFSR